MAIYHVHYKNMSRSKYNAVAAASYRSGERLYCEKEGLTKYPHRGVNDVVSSGIINYKFNDERGEKSDHLKRLRLWNNAERLERRSNSRVARELEVALPHELSDKQREDLTKNISQNLAKEFNVAVDYNIHKPSNLATIERNNKEEGAKVEITHNETEDRPRIEANHHAHIMFTTRQSLVDENGNSYLNGGAKSKDNLNRPLDTKDKSKERLMWIREMVGEELNQALALANIKERVDHRSLQEQGIERVPGKKRGPAINGTLERLEKAFSQDGDENARRKDQSFLENSDYYKIIKSNELEIGDLVHINSEINSLKKDKFFLELEEQNQLIEGDINDRRESGFKQLTGESEELKTAARRRHEAIERAIESTETIRIIDGKVQKYNEAARRRHEAIEQVNDNIGRFIDKTRGRHSSLDRFTEESKNTKLKNGALGKAVDRVGRVVQDQLQRLRSWVSRARDEFDRWRDR